jgi:hypothetical protein
MSFGMQIFGRFFRRPVRFRLRTLLLLLFVVSAALAFWTQTIGYYLERVLTARADFEHRQSLVSAFNQPPSFHVSRFYRDGYELPEWYATMPDWVRRFVPTVDNQWFARGGYLVIHQFSLKSGPPMSPTQARIAWDDLWGVVARIDELEALGISSTHFEDDDLPRLAGLPGLALLNLRATGITDAGLERLKSGFPSLRYLMVPDHIGEAARRQLTAARPELYVECPAQPFVRGGFKADLAPGGDAELARRDAEFPDLRRFLSHGLERDLFRLDGAGRVRGDQELLLQDPILEKLRRNPRLETLLLNPLGTPLRDIDASVIDRIVQLPTVRYLGLRGRLQPHGVFERLKELPKLETLWLYDSAFTEADIAAVAKLPHLKRFLLTISRAETDVAGLEARIRTALPNIEVSFDYELPQIEGEFEWRGPEWAVDLRTRVFSDVSPFDRHSSVIHADHRVGKRKFRHCGPPQAFTQSSVVARHFPQR